MELVSAMTVLPDKPRRKNIVATEKICIAVLGWTSNSDLISRQIR